VKTALLTPERTVTRKIKEVILALWTEKIYSKEKILEMYLNQVPYGGSSYGIEEAAKTYFGKKAKELNLEEAALLAGLPQAPSLYSPYVNPEAALNRRNEVLRSMKSQSYINEELRVKSEELKIDVLPPKRNKSHHAHIERQYCQKMQKHILRCSFFDVIHGFTLTNADLFYQFLKIFNH